jgi:hypothetical protein
MQTIELAIEQYSPEELRLDAEARLLHDPPPPPKPWPKPLPSDPRWVVMGMALVDLQVARGLPPVPTDLLAIIHGMDSSWNEPEQTGNIYLAPTEFGIPPFKFDSAD